MVPCDGGAGAVRGYRALLRRRNAVERRGIDYAGLGVSWCAGRCRTPLTETVDMVKAIQRAGGNARLTVFETAAMTHGRMRMMKCSCSGCWHKKRTETDK